MPLIYSCISDLAFNGFFFFRSIGALDFSVVVHPYPPSSQTSAYGQTRVIHITLHLNDVLTIICSSMQVHDDMGMDKL